MNVNVRNFTDSLYKAVINHAYINASWLRNTQ